MRVIHESAKHGYKLVSYLGQCLEVPNYTTHIAADADGELWAYDNVPDKQDCTTRGTKLGYWSESRLDGYEMRYERIDTRLTLEDARDNWQNSVRAVKPWVKYPRCLYVITVACCEGDEGAGLAMYEELEHLMRGDSTNLAIMFAWGQTPQGHDYWRGINHLVDAENLEDDYLDSIK